MENEKLYCKSCCHFKNAQRELNYHNDIGFCVNDKFTFDTSKGRIVGVYDKNNVKDVNVVSGNPSHDIESIQSFLKIKQSKYLLQVSEDFGCIYHEKK